MIYLICITAWLFIVWHLIAKRFPNDGPQLRRWVWFIPGVPIICGLMFVTAIAEVFVALTVGGFIYGLKEKFKNK